MVDKKVFDFKKQLAYSHAQEAAFLNLYQGESLTLSLDRKWDYITENGLKMELKTDTYDTVKTPNFFMERYSDISKKSPGGPWRSLEHGVDLFVYWFPSNKVYYEFQDLAELVKVLDVLTDKQYMMSVRNKGWLTGGYKVLRESLQDLYKKVEYK